MNFRIVYLIAAVIIFSAAPGWAQFTQRGTTSSGQGMEVTADKLTAGNGGTKIEATGNVEIKREPMTLKADEVRVNRETQDIEAKGKVSVDDPEWKVKSADSMQMNMGTETGEFQNGDIFIEQGHLSLSGRRFQKFGGQTYHVDDGFFTTCLCESGVPSWKFSAEQMDLSIQ
jgi:LPS-assembly protein